jgi:(p)ppGpp synthase/HD superfamily hydrolase
MWREATATREAGASVPEPARGSDLVEAAFRFAAEAHHGPRRAGDTDVGHPLEAARILRDAGFADTVVAAALLHDVLEDTRTGEDELRRSFGDGVARLVAALSEDTSIEPYEERKRAHRAQVMAAGRDAAAIFAADKLATLRALEDPPRLPARKLAHFSRVVAQVSSDHPELPFLGELTTRLAAVRPDTGAT